MGSKPSLPSSPQTVGHREVIIDFFIFPSTEGLKAEFEQQSIDIKDVGTTLFLPTEKTPRSLKGVTRFGKAKEECPFLLDSIGRTAGLSTKPKVGNRTDCTISSVIFYSRTDHSIFTDQEVRVMSCYACCKINAT